MKICGIIFYIAASLQCSLMADWVFAVVIESRSPSRKARKLPNTGI